MRKKTLLLALPLLLFACGGGSDPASLVDSGTQALNSADYATAKADFEAALTRIGGDATHPSFKRASLGAIEAEVHLDPVKAKNDFLDLAAAQSGQLTAKDYATVGNQLASEKQYLEALAVLDTGIQAHAEAPQLVKLLDYLKAEAKKPENAGLASGLAGLGYIGD